MNHNPTGRWQIWSLWVGAFGVLHGCGGPRLGSESVARCVGAESGREAAVQRVPLAGFAGNSDLELSGLAWSRDWLILIPENLGLEFGLLGNLIEGEQFLLKVPRAQVEAVVEGRSAALEPIRVPVSPSIVDVPGFDGFEAAVFDDGGGWLSIETFPRDDGHVYGALVRAEVVGDFAAIELDLAGAIEVRSPIPRTNASEEALVLVDDGQVLSLYELNGALLNASPVAHLIESGVPVRSRPFPHLEYRVTDATALDDDGRFWVVNYNWPGSTTRSSEEDLTPEPLAMRDGCGVTHGRWLQVERLVELAWTGERVELTDTAPINLELVGDWAAGHSRNWEGIVRFGDGFLVVTDRFPPPETVLGYVRAP